MVLLVSFGGTLHDARLFIFVHVYNKEGGKKKWGNALSKLRYAASDSCTSRFKISFFFFSFCFDRRWKKKNTSVTLSYLTLFVVVVVLSRRDLLGSVSWFFFFFFFDEPGQLFIERTSDIDVR